MNYLISCYNINNKGGIKMNAEEKVKMIQMQIESIQKITQKTKELNEIQERFSKIREQIQKADKDSIIFLQKAKDEGLEYVKKMNDLLGEIDLLNKESVKLDKKDIETLTQYLKVYSEFNVLTSKIQTIEKLSKKSSNNKIETKNAEGRKKQIDETLFDEYEDLVAQKKQLNSKYLQIYNKLMNYDIHPTKENDEEELKEEDRLKEVKKEIKSVKSLPQSTEDEFVPVDDKKYSMSNFGKLCYLNNQKRQLEENEPDLKDNQVPIENPEKIVITNIDKKKKLSMKQKLKRIAIAATIGIATTVSIFGLKKGQKALQTQSKIESNTDSDDLNEPEIVIFNEDQVANAQNEKIKEENVISNEKEQNGLLNETKENVVIQNNEALSQIEPVDIGVIDEDYTLSTSEDDISSLQLGDSFIIDDSAQIYSNEYDATRETNGKHPLFEKDKERSTVGIVYTLPNGEIVVARNDEDIQKYEAAGGTITSYLAGNENGKEGFYNADNVIPSNQELGGKNL